MLFWADELPDERARILKHLLTIVLASYLLNVTVSLTIRQICRWWAKQNTVPMMLIDWF
jgi:hypothetical protein